jgi:chaperonin GroES
MEKVKPLGDRVLVKVNKVDEKTRGGVILVNPTSMQEMSEGVIIEVGPGRRAETAGGVVNINVNLNVGDRVLFAKNVGANITIGDEPHRILRETDIIAVHEIS